ncbi:hypothetical protein C8R45DRAFT_944469 [Mycena sanguinolenta]|nr:hypothetical protein C8R45DRAFT_944469 [Mycena sanguinolenta]
MARLRAFFGGRGLSALSRALLESGQDFYLIAVATNITLLVGVKLPQLSPVYRAMLAIPGYSLINAMACLVFRRIKLGAISSDIGLFSNLPATENPISLRLQCRNPTTTDFESNTNFPPPARVQRETHRFEDGADVGEGYSKSINLA